VRLREKGCLQPCLFRTVSQHYFLKYDNKVIPLPSASCCTEAVEYLYFFYFGSSMSSILHHFAFLGFSGVFGGCGTEEELCCPPEVCQAIIDEYSSEVLVCPTSLTAGKK